MTREELGLREGFWFHAWLISVRYIAPGAIVIIIIKSWFGFWFS
jgi:hypothetical protein